MLADAASRTLANSLILNGNVTLAPSGFGGSSSSGSGLTLSGSVNLAANSTITDTAGGLGNILSGSISGTGQLTVTGLGSLTLSANSTFSGGTVLNAGVFASLGTLALGNSSALGSGPLTLTDGTIKANASINLSNTIAFTNGNSTGNSYIAFTGSPISFVNSGGNTINGSANLVVNTSTTFNEPLGNGSFVGNLNLVSGTSTLFLQGTDTYTGNTTVGGGTLVLNGNGTLDTGGVAVDVGATFIEDNTSNNNFASGTNPFGTGGRLQSLTTGLTLNGGTYKLLGGSGGTTENFGISGITVDVGNSTIVTDSTHGSAEITTAIFYRVNGATVNFQAAGTQTLGTSANEILVTQFSTAFGGAGPVNNIFPYATVTDHTAFNNGFNLAAYGADGIEALPSSSYTPQTSLTYSASDSTANVLVTTSLALTASDTVNAMLLVGDGITVSGPAGSTLTAGSGQFVSTGGTSIGNTIAVPTLAFGSAEGIVTTNSGLDTINGTITGTNGFTITGPGNLILPHASNYNNSSNPSGQSQDVQVITIGTTATGGSFTLTFDGATTAAISFNNSTTTVANILSALLLLPTIGAGNVTVTNGSGQTQSGPFTVTFTGGLAGADQPLILAPAAGNTLAVGAGQAAAVITTNIVVAGANATALNSGTLTLGTNNAISQGLTIIGGTIFANSEVTLPNAVDFGSAGLTANGAEGTLASSVVTVAGTNPVIFGGGVNLLGLTATLNVIAPTIITGVIDNGLAISGVPNTFSSTALVKQGSGTLTLATANNYTTPTLIGQGVVNVRNNASLGPVVSAVQVINFSSSVTTNSTFTLAFNGATTNAITYSSVAATLVSNIQSALTALSTIGAGNSLVSGTTITTITVAFQNTLADLSLPNFTVPLGPTPGTAGVTTTIPGVAPETVGVASGATLQLQGGTNNLTLSQTFILNGTGATINGSPVGAIENLSGSNTIAGALPGTAPGTIALASATSLGGNVGTLTLSGTISGGADLTTAGQGTLVLTGANTYTGQTNITLGVVQLGLATGLSAIGTLTPLGSNASGVVVSSGASLVTLIITNGIQATFDAGKPLTLNGDGLGYVLSGLQGEVNNGDEVTARVLSLSALAPPIAPAPSGPEISRWVRKPRSTRAVSTICTSPAQSADLAR